MFFSSGLSAMLSNDMINQHPWVWRSTGVLQSAAVGTHRKFLVRDEARGTDDTIHYGCAFYYFACHEAEKTNILWPREGAGRRSLRRSKYVHFSTPSRALDFPHPSNRYLSLVVTTIPGRYLDYNSLGLTPFRTFWDAAPSEVRYHREGRRYHLH